MLRSTSLGSSPATTHGDGDGGLGDSDGEGEESSKWGKLKRRRGVSGNKKA